MKSIIYVVAFLALAAQLQAQDGVATFGIKVGMVSPSLRGSDIDSISNAGPATSKTGITVGIFVNSRLGRYVWLKHELQYSVRMMNVQLSDKNNAAYTTTYARNYIDIFPLSPTFHFKGLQIYAGPYMGILSQAWINRKDAAGNFYKDKSIYGSSTQFYTQHQKFDMGLVAGIEYEFPFGVSLGAKYVKGFVPVIEYPNANTFNDPHSVINVYNSYVNVTLGYSFVKREKNK